MLLMFGLEGVLKLIEHVTSSERHRALPSVRAGSKGLFLTADEGVYLTSSGMPMLIRNPEEKVIKRRKPFVVFADGCDAEGEYAQWWDCQKRAFGVDPAMIFIPLVMAVRALGKTHLSMVVKKGEVTAMGPHAKDTEEPKGETP